MTKQAFPQRTEKNIPSELFSNEIYFSEVERILSEGQSVQIPAKGKSMFPFIHDRKDLLIVGHAENLETGDIVLAHLPNGIFVLHRIIQFSSQHIILMGDGNIQAKEYCQRSQIIGKVYFILRNGRKIDCNSPAEKRKAFFWQKLLPIRRYLLFLFKLFIPIKLR